MKISLTAGWEDFLEIQRDERVILEHTALGIICTRSFHFSPECTKIVSGWGSAPDPAGGAYSAPPDPLAVMGWDGDLVTTFFGCKLCAPLLMPGAPLLFWGWLRAWHAYADALQIYSHFSPGVGCIASCNAGLTTRLTRLQPRAPDFLGAPERSRPLEGLNEFSLMCEIRDIMNIVLVQFCQILYPW